LLHLVLGEFEAGQARDVKDLLAIDHRAVIVGGRP
jgi:hypothetical protein